MWGDAGGPPDFLGVGAHLSGTVWWRGLLAKHPQISLRRTRHRRLDTYFEPFSTAAMTAGDIAGYHRRFRPRPGTVVGEWSDRYLYNPWMLPLLARAAPDAKLLLLTRDPVERFRTALGYRVGTGDPASDTVHMTEAFHRGRYASQLRALHRFFGPHRVLVLQYERCLREPREQYRRTLEFLGVDPAVLPSRIDAGPRERTLVGRLLRRPEPVDVTLWPDLQTSLQTVLTPEVTDLADLVPDLDLSLWPAFAHLAR
ncbi:MAG: hypothetical protein QOF76_4641 [Solirubrobacteraceae bacterium]|nr:hypothetical protein [Solirubrobacteraceae bacterium]